jgi:hypothetical protein
MLYALIKNNQVSKYPYLVDQLKTDNRNVSFPAEIPKSLLEEYGCFEVLETLKPITDYTKNIIEGTPINSGGKWNQKWEVTETSVEEKEQRLRNKWDSFRDERNKLLSDSDWTQVADAPVDNLTWVVYRQTLRDLPQNNTNPFTIVWPQKPS